MANSIFPSIDSSFRHQPHIPLATNLGPAPPNATPNLDSGSIVPLSAATVVNYHTTKITDSPFAWITSLISVPIPTHTTTPNHSLSTASHSSTSTPQPDARTSSEQGMSEGIKVGVIVGIVIVVLLSLILAGYCVLDGRHRVQRWQEQRRARRDAEINMWETELRNGNSGRRDIKAEGGLWGGLRIDNKDITNVNTENRSNKKDPTLDKYERRLASVGMWERVGHSRNEVGKRDDTISSDTKKGVIAEHRTAERENEWLPAYMPRERASIVSSAGSLGLPVVGPPIVPRSFLDKDDGR